MGCLPAARRWRARGEDSGKEDGGRRTADLPAVGPPAYVGPALPWDRVGPRGGGGAPPWLPSADGGDGGGGVEERAEVDAAGVEEQVEVGGGGIEERGGGGGGRWAAGRRLPCPWSRMAAGADLGRRDRRPARIWAEWRPWSAAVLDLGTAAVLCCERVERKASMRGVRAAWCVRDAWCALCA